MTIEAQLRELNAAQIQAGMIIGPAFSTILDLVLKHGRRYTLKPLPEGRWHGDFQLCFANALRAAKAGRWIYVEGYAIRHGTGGTAVLHAWVTDPNDPTVAYDPTWSDGAEYFGIPFRVDYVLAMRKKAGHPGVLDAWELRWPLVTGADRIEDVIWRANGDPAGAELV